MERKRLLICVLLSVCAVVLVIGLYFLYQAQFIKLDMSFASSAVIEYRGQDGASVTLTPEETDKLKSCFTGNMKSKRRRAAASVPTRSILLATDRKRSFSPVGTVAAALP